MYERSKKNLHLTALILYYLIVYYFLKKRRDMKKLKFMTRLTIMLLILTHTKNTLTDYFLATGKLYKISAPNKPDRQGIFIGKDVAGFTNWPALKSSQSFDNNPISLTAIRNGQYDRTKFLYFQLTDQSADTVYSLPEEAFTVRTASEIKSPHEVISLKVGEAYSITNPVTSNTRVLKYEGASASDTYEQQNLYTKDWDLNNSSNNGGIKYFFFKEFGSGNLITLHENALKTRIIKKATGHEVFPTAMLNTQQEHVPLAAALASIKTDASSQSEKQMHEVEKSVQTLSQSEITAMIEALMRNQRSASSAAASSSSASSAVAHVENEHDFLGAFKPGSKYKVSKPKDVSGFRELTFVGFFPQSERSQIFDSKNELNTDKLYELAHNYPLSRASDDKFINMYVVFKDDNGEPVMYGDEGLKNREIKDISARPPLVTEATYHIGSVKHGYQKLTYVGYYHPKGLVQKNGRVVFDTAAENPTAPYSEEGDNVLLEFKDEAGRKVVFRPSELDQLDLSRIEDEDENALSVTSAPSSPGKSSLKKSDSPRKEGVTFSAKNEIREIPADNTGRKPKRG